jgi:hypothetical protein
VLSDLKEQWAKRGKIIHTAEDLILCYYSSFKVICVPDLPAGIAGIKPSRLIAEQYKKLYREIQRASKKLRNRKLRLGMNLDVESFNLYVEHAFNRLTRDLQSYIDFYYLASHDEIIPTRINEHLAAVIVKMLKMGKYSTSNELGQEKKLLSRLIPYLAWCIAATIQALPEGSGESIKSPGKFWKN